MTTQFKICGLRDARHAIFAAELGAHFLGFVFVDGVRRQLTPQRAAEIISEYRRDGRSEGPKVVGLFANQPIDFVNDVAALCALDFAQLCGDETPEYWEQVNPAIIKQIKVRTDTEDVSDRDEAIAITQSRVDDVLTLGHMALLDAYEPGQLGGTGTTFDWSIAAAVARDSAIVLAGGLSPDNVDLAITKVAPWGVDVSSGVESEPGKKDFGLMKSFVEAVQKAEFLT